MFFTKIQYSFKSTLFRRFYAQHFNLLVVPLFCFLVQTDCTHRDHLCFAALSPVVLKDPTANTKKYISDVVKCTSVQRTHWKWGRKWKTRRMVWRKYENLQFFFTSCRNKMIVLSLFCQIFFSEFFWNYFCLHFSWEENKMYHGRLWEKSILSPCCGPMLVQTTNSNKEPWR